MPPKKPPGLELPHSRPSSSRTSSNRTSIGLDQVILNLSEEPTSHFMDDFHELLEKSSEIDNPNHSLILKFFNKYPYHLFYDSDDKYFLEINDSNEKNRRETSMNQQIQQGFFEFIKEITNKEMIEIEPTAEIKKQLASFNQTHQGHQIELKPEGLSLTDIQRILDKNDPTNYLLNIYQRKEDWRYKYEMNSKLYHVIQLCIGLFKMMLINKELTIQKLEKFIQISQISENPYIQFILHISQYLVGSINKFKTLQNINKIHFDQTIYTLDSIAILYQIFENEELKITMKYSIQENIDQFQKNLKKIKEVKGLDIIQTIKQLLPTNITMVGSPIIKETSFHFRIQLKSNSFLPNIFTKTKQDIFPPVECLFQKMSEGEYSLKIKTAYSDIINIRYMYDNNTPPNPYIRVDIVKNPISFKVFDHYPQVIQTYYCFTILLNDSIMNQIYNQLDFMLNPTSTRKTSLQSTFKGRSILEKYTIGGVRRDDLYNAIGYGKNTELVDEFKKLSEFIQTKKEDILDEFYRKYSNVYILDPHQTITDKKHSIYCVVKDNQECIKPYITINSPINGGKKMIKTSRKKKTNGRV